MSERTRLILYIIVLALLTVLQAGGYYIPRDCVEYKIHNPLANYDPITLKEIK